MLEHRIDQGKDQAEENGAVEAKGGTAVHRIIILAPQSPAHHTGAAHAEQVIDGVEGQQDGGCQSDGRILDGVVQHADKIGVGQVVKDHDQRAEHSGDGQLQHGLWYRGLLK